MRRPDRVSADLVGSLSSGPLPGSVTRSTVVIPPGASLPYDAAAWQGALVLLTAGSVHLVPADGRGVHFRTGAILTLQGLALRSIENPGSDPAVLVVLTRA